jgi:hypothetical protein
MDIKYDAAMRTTFLVRSVYDAIDPPSNAAARARGAVQQSCSPVRSGVVRMSYNGRHMHSSFI